MSPGNRDHHRHDSRNRCLRLERLESRSLLAAGLFDLTIGDHARPPRVHDVPAEIDKRGGEVDKQGLDHRRRSDRSARIDTRSSEVSAPPVFQPIPTQNREGEPVAEPTIVFVSTPSRLPPAPTFNLLALDVVSADVSLATTDFAATNDPLRPPVNAIDSLFAIPTSNAAEPALDQGTLNQGTTNETDRRTRLPKEVESKPIGGLIKLVPDADWSPLDRPFDQPESNWALDRSTFPKLKRTIESSSDETAQLDENAVDRRWNHFGGMIAIDQVRLPVDLFPTTSDAIQVQLESTVMLYRSLDLFATSNVSSNESEPLHGPLSDRTIDNIMATLGSLADFVGQPVAETHPTRLRSLVYPFAALVFSGAAISAKRKSDASLLLHSKRPARKQASR